MKRETVYSVFCWYKIRYIETCKNDPVKDRKALATYVELKGYKHGEMGNGRKKTCQNGTSTLDEIAKELNMSKRNLQRALRIELET